MAYVLTIKEQTFEGGVVKLFETKGSSSLLVVDGRSFFIPKKHIREDKDNNDDTTIFLCEEWEYSEAKSHYDEKTKQYVKDPIVYEKGKNLIRLLHQYSSKCVKLPPKAVNKDDELPF